MLCFSICHTCWYGVSLSAVPAGVMPHYRPYLLMWYLNISPAVLMWCLSVGHAFWCGASLQAMPSGVVPHYQPCLQVCCLTIGHSFWRGASLSTMPIGVLPRYRSCLLVWCLIINHAVGVVPHSRPCLLAWYLTICHCNQHFTSRVQMEEGRLQVWCYLYRGTFTSDMSADLVPLSDMPSCTMQLLSDVNAGFMNSSTHFCKVLLYQTRYLICYKIIRHAYRYDATPKWL